MPHSDDFLAVHDSAAPGSVHAPENPARWWRFAVLLVAGLLALCALTWLVSVQRGIAALQQSTAMRADRYAGTLESTLDRYEFLPALVSLHPSVRALLAAPQDAARIAAVNDYLSEVNGRARASATYVIAANGLALAASNHGEPGSFVGTDYRFRPYFQMASRGQVGRFYAIGVTSDEPGYYIAQPIEAGGKVIGVTVVKLNLEWFQRAGSGRGEPLMVSDDHGVIFLSSVPGWQYRTLRPLPPALQAEMHRTRQYHDVDVTPLPLQPLTSPVMRWLARNTLADNQRLVRVGPTDRGGADAAASEAAPDGIDGIGWSLAELSGGGADRYLEISRAVGPAGWNMQVMAPLDPVLANARSATIGAALAYACVCLLLVNLRQRRQRARDMLYSRRLLEAAYDELERRVEARTADLMAINEQLEAEVAERTRAESELRATQDELVQASKLAALGQMAAGITHELNQPLAALRTFSDNTRVLLERGQLDAATGNLSAIADLTERMGKITGQLKLFAGKARPRRHAVAVRAAVDHVLQLIAPRLGPVALTVRGLDGDAGDLAVWADELKLEQVLLNLVGNALDAIAAQGRPDGRVGIDIDADAERVRIAVHDNGTGIAPDALPHLFEPFYTTKEIGQGLGLGLAISSSIVREFGGQLVAGNAAGGGAEFVVTLRRARQPVAA
ncbi:MULTISPECIES: sensor histidine kinase [unclassified Cupriavidus]|uniref:sensor histidine kinase n=1 Tax=unclassified Cupriavidus TaxID=2640874 RepID=UPI0028B84822|nr:sensor histidine kinase [Cupriavidus sp. SZY C1]MDT6962355.1 sensor histidine kinase [Cupriavidus sp. SZY C1]